jgi:hypothetical protein
MTHTQSMTLLGRFLPSKNPVSKAENVCNGNPGTSVKSQPGRSDLDEEIKTFRSEALSYVAAAVPTITP